MIIILIICIIIAALLFCLTPCTRRKEQMRELAGSGLFAHRGLHDNAGAAPENTLEAFQKAVRAGFGIELDVQLTKDLKLVIFHDDDLRRVCGADLQIKDLTLAEIQAYTVCGSDQSPPRFEDALSLIDGQVPLIIELKTCNRRAELCARVAEVLDHYKGDYCLESFDPLILRWFKNHRPQILRGQLSTNFRKENTLLRGAVKFLLTNLLLNCLSRPDFIAYNFQHRNRLTLRLCRKLFRPVTAAWTIKNPADAALARQDFDILIFDSFTPKET